VREPDNAAPLILRAPIKINLALHILGRRADGYHDLESLVVFSNCGDRLSLLAARRDSFRALGPYAARLGARRNNLALKALAALRAQLGAAAVPPVAIELDKQVPVAAGLGGGSADAAAAIYGLARLYGLYADGAEAGREAAAPPPQLMAIAAELGADVPMCLAWFYRRSAYLAGGRGEKLAALPGFPALPLAVVNNGAPLSTRAVFAALDLRDIAARPPLPAAAEVVACRNLAEWTALLRRLRNDLYAPAVAAAPQLPQMLALLRQSGAVWCAMSGSGASCFGLYESLAAAEQGAAFIRARHPHYYAAAMLSDGAPLPARPAPG